jgi:hypothetical protein
VVELEHAAAEESTASVGAAREELQEPAGKWSPQCSDPRVQWRGGGRETEWWPSGASESGFGSCMRACDRHAGPARHWLGESIHAPFERLARWAHLSAPLL